MVPLIPVVPLPASLTAPSPLVAFASFVTKPLCTHAPAHDLTPTLPEDVSKLVSNLKLRR